MVDNKLLKDYLINATALGYDVHKAIELGRTIRTEDDISESLHKLRTEGELTECYYKEVTLDEVINIIENAKGINKHTLLNSLDRQLKGLKSAYI